MAAKLKKGDKVVVLAGKDKGKEGEISVRHAPKPTRPSWTASTLPSVTRSQSQTSQGGRVPQGHADRPEQSGAD